MRVLLKQDWFGPNAHLYTRDPNGHAIEIPELYRADLPPNSVVLSSGSDQPAAPVAPMKHETLRDYDEIRSAADAEDALLASKAAKPTHRSK